MYSRKPFKLVIGVSVLMLSACSMAANYTEGEKEMVANMTPSKYQPATRELRNSIETQDILAQAAFWSKEYQLNPADLEAIVKLAASVRKMGNAAKAVEITQTSRAMYPTDPYLIAEYAAALIAIDRGSEALKPLDQALRGAPNYARLWSLKGAALDQVSKFDQARQHYGRALQITPNDPNIMANMGLSFALAGDPVTAERWLRQAANQADASDSIRQNLDLILQLQGKPAQMVGRPRPAQPQAQRQYSAPRSTTPMSQTRLPAPSQPSYGSSQYQAPASAPIGHRSNKVYAGNQPGAPRNAAELARSIAAQNNQKRVVVPHQTAPQAGQGNILDQISRSVAQKRVPAGPHQNQMRRAPQPVQGQHQAAPMQQGQYPSYAPQQNTYPQAMGNPTRRGAARRR